ncbi:hypothetical protein SM0020_12420 [Sinorhizobium meliloti CCNWSX0020]|uniref:AAA+ ATPase domain-containing protein n=1 Tax=Sinorhizobium meliloti CCNWSX0020 TaxID=1107881 RepID=H0FZ50_RHIML|nr:ATP-binding protein [Sinorhizobium meliloti]EHK77730.1 hypothetical protein SM0020_12420 [Sinorhizobium meliloti CCNWSX0020]
MNDFVDAVRDDTSLLIAIAGASGSGKTFSALKMATGLAQGEPIYAIDTEAKRMLHYADQFKFKHMDMKPPFTPEAYIDAIQKAERAGAKVIIIDSTSDEYEGVGGLQEMHDEEVARLARKPYDRLEGWEIDKFNAPAWKVPKTRHKTRLMSPLRQVRAYIIFCLRAEEKIKFVKVFDERSNREKTAIESAGWVPICEKRFMYEMTMSFTVTPDNPGVPLIEDGQAVHGKIQSQHLPFFPAGKRVDEECGRKLRAWARGENTSASQDPPASSSRQADTGAGPLSSSQEPAPTHDRALLTEYHQKLAGEISREDLISSHEEFKPRFAKANEATAEAAKSILRAHTMRLKDEADADTTNTYVQGLIDGE